MKYSFMIAVVAVITSISVGRASSESIPDGEWILVEMPLTDSPLDSVSKGLVVPYYTQIKTFDDKILFTFAKMNKGTCSSVFECGRFNSPLTVTMNKRLFRSSLTVSNSEVQPNIVVVNRNIDDQHIINPWVSFLEGSSVSNVTPTSFSIANGPTMAKFVKGDVHAIEAALAVERLADVAPVLDTKFCVLKQITDAINHSSSGSMIGTLIFTGVLISNEPSSALLPPKVMTPSDAQLIDDWTARARKLRASGNESEFIARLCHNVLLEDRLNNPHAGYDAKLNGFIGDIRNYVGVPDVDGAEVRATQTGITLTVVTFTSVDETESPESEVSIILFVGLSDHLVSEISTQSKSRLIQEEIVDGESWSYIAGSPNGFIKVFEGGVAIAALSDDVVLLREAIEVIDIGGLLAYRP